MIKDLTIIILTFNEEKRIRRVLDSVKEITDTIFVVDSYSQDKTLEILTEKVKHTLHPYENYSKQRNWSQKNEPFNNEWVMHLDADEPITPELASWLKNDFQELKYTYDGLFSRRVYWGDG